MFLEQCKCVAEAANVFARKSGDEVLIASGRIDVPERVYVFLESRDSLINERSGCNEHLVLGIGLGNNHHACRFYFEHFKSR